MDGPRIQDIGQLTIIGTGLLGTSITLGLREAGFGGRIVGVGRSRETLDRAVQRGGLDIATTHVAEALPASQLVVVAVPLGGFAAVLGEIARHDHDDLVVTDVGSAKGVVWEQARRHLPVPSRFVGSHPMAGSEQQGPEAARADLFRDKPCIITAEPGSNPYAVVTVESLWRLLGMSLLRMTTSEHDRRTALVSHLPHVAAVALVRVAARHGGWEVASTGFRDTTRLASSNPPMRADIMTANRDQIMAAIDVYRAELDKLRDTLARRDDAALVELLANMKDTRDEWVNGCISPPPKGGG